MLRSQADADYKNALALYESGNIAECKKQLEALLASMPLHGDAQNDLGSIYFLEGSPERALGPLSIALGLDPKNPDYRENYDAVISKLKEGFKNEKLSKIRVAMFYDEEGWAWWIRSHAIKESLPPDIEVDILQLHTLIEPSQYDFLLIFDHNVVQEVRATTAIPVEKIILANSCPLYITQADQFLKQQGFSAAIVNNQTAYKVVQSDPRWHCCENGVNTTLFCPPAQRPSEFLAGWVGNSKSIGQKGLDIIQEACRLADVPLLIVDASEKPKDLKANSQEWLRDNLYHKVSVYLCASQYEGTPNPALEALACGLPVITTRVGNMPELIRDGINGYIVERDADSLARALKLIRDRDLSQAARDSVSPSWDWQEKAKNYARIFRQLKDQGYE